MIKTWKKNTALAMGIGLGALSAPLTANAAECEYVLNDTWSGGFSASIHITNNDATAIDGWEVHWQYQNNVITNSWNANITGSYTATPLSWNSTIQPSQTVEFGFQGNTNGGAAETPEVTGDVCQSTEPPPSQSGIFDDALWRIVSRSDRSTLSVDNGASPVGAMYLGEIHQHWRVNHQGNNGYEFELEENGQCLIDSGSSVALGACGGSSALWLVETLRQRSEQRPALYRLKTASTSECLRISESAAATAGACDDQGRVYIEPVGWGERSFPQEYEYKDLLLVKPNTNVPGLTQGSMTSDQTDGAQQAFTSIYADWLSTITDGRVVLNASSVVSTDPVTSLTAAGDNYLPRARDIPQDVQAHIPRGMYDSVQVLFTPGDGVTGGWGFGPGRNYLSNYALWSTVNGKNPSKSDWLQSTAGSPFEIFIHEPMHGFDGHFERQGIELPEGQLHGATQNLYGHRHDSNWLHWLRDYWLGTVIATDDTYRGYGPRAFRVPKVREWAVSAEADEYRIVHSGGLCISTESGTAFPDSETKLILSDDCDDPASLFLKSSEGMLEHAAGVMCVHPDQGTAATGVNLIYFSSCKPEDRLTISQTAAGSLQHDQTGLCVHPQGGSANPAVGTELVFWDGCDETRLLFDFVLQ